LGRAHATVGDRAHGTLEQRPVGDKRQDTRVGWNVDAGGVGCRQRGDDLEVLAGERLERRADEAAVVLELR
jgi:hypothetical protein